MYLQFGFNQKAAAVSSGIFSNFSPPGTVKAWRAVLRTAVTVPLPPFHFCCPHKDRPCHAELASVAGGGREDPREELVPLAVSGIHVDNFFAGVE